MCLSCADGGRRCRDPRRLKRLTVSDLSPDVDEQHPAVEWAQDDLEDLWAQLPAPVVSEAVAVLAETRDVEHRTTADITESLPTGVRPHGLEFRVKSPASLARKIAARAKAGFAQPSTRQQPHDISDKLTDVLRYTAITTEHDELVPTVLQCVTAAQSKGYRVVSAEHSYVQGNAYKGIHVLLQHDDERPVELQFHSELSQRIKDDNHLDYEIERVQDSSFRIRAEAARRMRARSGQIPVPDGLDALEEIGACQLRVKRYPNRYGLTDNEEKEVGSDD